MYYHYVKKISKNITDKNKKISSSKSCKKTKRTLSNSNCDNIHNNNYINKSKTIMTKNSNICNNKIIRRIHHDIKNASISQPNNITNLSNINNFTISKLKPKIILNNIKNSHKKINSTSNENFSHISNNKNQIPKKYIINNTNFSNKKNDLNRKIIVTNNKHANLFTNQKIINSNNNNIKYKKIIINKNLNHAKCNTAHSTKILLNIDENNHNNNISNNTTTHKTISANIRPNLTEINIPNIIYETDKVSVTYDKKTGNKIVNDFYFIETIGHGAYSKVKKCINLKTKEEFAVKILNKRLLRKKKKSYGKTKEGTLKINYMIDDALNEINIYKSFPYKNKNILQLYQILNDNKKDKTYLIMELCNKGPLVTLNEKTGTFILNKNYNDNIYNEKLIKEWIFDIANGLKFLHENNIVHRDIKSDNILIDKDGHCKIADFGCSIKLKTGNELFSKTEGNMYFYPPEFVDGKSKKLFSYKPVDIWAFGVTIYTCIYKILPFLPENRENVVELFKEIREAKFDFNKNGIKISRNMEDLLNCIFEKDPNKRFTAKDIVEYPWLNQEKL